MRSTTRRSWNSCRWARLTTVLTLLASALLGPTHRCCAAPGSSLPNLLPPECAVVVDLHRGSELLAQLEKSGLTDRVLESRVMQAYQASPDAADLTRFLAVLQKQTQLSTATLIEHILSGPLALGIRYDEVGKAQFLLAVRLQHPETFTKLLGLARALAGEDATERHSDGLHRFRIANIVGCRAGDLLLLSQERALVEAAIQRQRSAAPDGIGTQARYQSAASARSGQMFLYLDLATIRAHGPWLKRLTEPRKNAGESLLLGGYERLLGSADHLGAHLDVSGQQITVRAVIDAATVPDSHECFFPASAEMPPLLAGGQISRLAIRRDALRWWQAQGSLVTERVRLGMQRFQTDIANLLGGADFDEEILPNIGQEGQLLLFQPDTTADALPEPLLPDMALVLPCSAKAAFADQMRVSFQTLVGFLNLERMQQQERPLMLGATVHKGFLISSATPLPPVIDEEGNTGDGSAAGGEQARGIEDNFAVSLAIHGDRLVLGSNLAAARRAIDSLTQAPTTPRSAATGDALWLDGAQLQQILHANRPVFLAQAVLEGKTIEQATHEQAMLHEIISWFQTATARTTLGTSATPADTGEAGKEAGTGDAAASRLTLDVALTFTPLATPDPTEEATPVEPKESF